MSKKQLVRLIKLSLLCIFAAGANYLLNFIAVFGGFFIDERSEAATVLARAWPSE